MKIYRVLVEPSLFHPGKDVRLLAIAISVELFKIIGFYS